MKLKTCEKGHQFYKSSDCLTCPICENVKAALGYFLDNLAAPARRALEHQNITTLEKLAEFTEREILQLHGMGKSSIPKLKLALTEKHLTFK